MFNFSPSSKPGYLEHPVLFLWAVAYPTVLKALYFLCQCIEQGITSDSGGRGRQPAEN